MSSTCSHSSLCCFNSPRALDWKPPSRILSFFSSFAAFRASAVMWARFTWMEKDIGDKTRVSSNTLWFECYLGWSSIGYLLCFADLKFFLKAFNAVFLWCKVSSGVPVLSWQIQNLQKDWIKKKILLKTSLSDQTWVLKEHKGMFTCP